MRRGVVLLLHLTSILNLNFNFNEEVPAMRKAIATTIIVLVFVGATVLILSACALYRGSKSASVAVADRSAPVYRGQITAPRADGQSHYSLGCVFQDRKKHRLAVKEFEMAVQGNPGHVAAYNRMGVSLDALGDHGKAVAAYTAALEVDPNQADVLNNLGYSHLLQGRWEPAIESFQKAVALDGANPRYRNNLGLAYARHGDDAAALEAFTVNGQEAEAHLNVARLYYRIGLYEKAAVHFARASALKPSDDQASKGHAAAVSLARIHGVAKNQPEKTAPTPVPEAGPKMTGPDTDGFETIPAGAIENREFSPMAKAQIARSDNPLPNKGETPIYMAGSVGIAGPAENQPAARAAGEALRLKPLDGVQTVNSSGLEAVDPDKQPSSPVKIEIANGNGVNGMARQVGQYLKGKAFFPTYFCNASHFSHKTTRIYYTAGYLDEAYRLSQALPGAQKLEEVAEIRDGKAKISLRIGRDLMDFVSLFRQG
jgi:Flp pilus assembly protein TadD